LNFVF
ncbi:hypothetical protein CISIN_1g0447981mg, partial [Citrus sinensis]